LFCLLALRLNTNQNCEEQLFKIEGNGRMKWKNTAVQLLLETLHDAIEIDTQALQQDISATQHALLKDFHRHSQATTPDS